MNYEQLLDRICDYVKPEGMSESYYNDINTELKKKIKELEAAKKVVVKEVMAGENGAKRVKEYSVAMAEGLAYNYAAKAVDDEVLDKLQALADEAELTDKFADVIASKNKGMIMKNIMPELKGKADGKDINAVVAELCE